MKIKALQGGRSHGISIERIKWAAKTFDNTSLSAAALGITTASFNRLCRKHGISHATQYKSKGSDAKKD